MHKTAHIYGYDACIVLFFPILFSVCIHHRAKLCVSASLWTKSVSSHTHIHTHTIVNCLFYDSVCHAAILLRSLLGVLSLLYNRLVQMQYYCIYCTPLSTKRRALELRELSAVDVGNSNDEKCAHTKICAKLPLQLGDNVDECAPLDKTVCVYG